jgi:hypothetical protein
MSHNPMFLMQRSNATRWNYQNTESSEGVVQTCFKEQMTDWSINSISDVRGIMTKVLHGMDQAPKIIDKHIEWSVP